MRSTRRRSVWLAATTASLALVASACGGSTDNNGNGGGGNGGGKPANNAGPSLPKLSGQTIDVAAVWTGAEQKTFEKVTAGFEKATGATVNYTSTGDDIATVLGTKVKGGSPPDVAILPQPGLLQQFAQSGDLKPASSAVSSEIGKNYASIWTDLATSDGQLYGVWVDASNKSTVWYNTKLFAQAGAKPAATWDDLLSTAKTLSDSGVSVPVSIGGADGWTLTDWFENVYLRSAGADMYDKLATHDIKWTDPSVVSALITLKQLWGNKTLSGNPADALQAAFPDSVSKVYSANPTSAIVYEGSFVAAVITDASNYTVGKDAKWFPFPSVDGSGPSVVGGGDVAVTFTGSKAAQTFLQYLASPEAAAEMVSTGSFTSANKNLSPSAYPDANSKAVGQAIVEAGENFRFDMSDLAPSAFGGTVGAGEWKDLQDFLADPSNPKATAKQLEADAAKAFK